MGWTFPSTVDDISAYFTRNNTWQDVDLTGVVPSGTKGVVIAGWNTYGAGRVCGVRANGQTYDRSNDIYNDDHIYFFVALDSSLVFEAKVEDSNVSIYLIAYTSADIFDTNPNQIANTTNDYETKTAQASGVMMLAEVDNTTASDYNWALRKYGDTHDYYGPLHLARRRNTFGVVGIDGSDQFQFKQSHLVDLVYAYDHGSVVDDIVDCSTGSTYPDVTPSTKGSWQTVDLTSLVGSDAGKVVGAVLLRYGGSGAGSKVRPYGDSWDPECTAMYTFQVFHWVAVDDQDRFEAYAETGSTIRLVAYFTGEIEVTPNELMMNISNV